MGVTTKSGSLYKNIQNEKEKKNMQPDITSEPLSLSLIHACALFFTYVYTLFIVFPFFILIQIINKQIDKTPSCTEATVIIVVVGLNKVMNSVFMLFVFVFV